MRYIGDIGEVDNLLAVENTCLTWDRIVDLDGRLLPCRVSNRYLGRDSFGCNHW